jgi:hypothetical protein
MYVLEHIYKIKVNNIGERGGTVFLFYGTKVTVTIINKEGFMPFSNS